MVVVPAVLGYDVTCSPCIIDTRARRKREIRASTIWSTPEVPASQASQKALHRGSPWAPPRPFMSIQVFGLRRPCPSS